MSTAPHNRSVTRSTSGLVTTGIAAAIGLFLLGDAVLRVGWPQTMLWAPWALLVVWGIYVTTAASTIAVSDTAVDVQNLLRRHHLPWGSVTDIYMKYQVTIEADGRTIACWAGPSASRPPRVRAGQASVPRALRVKDALVDLWESRRAEPSSRGAATRSWDWILLAIGAVLVVWALGTLVL